jgi:hypothetical protein
VKKYYDWQKDNIKSDGWAKRVKEELEKIGLASIWQNKYEYNNSSAIDRVVKGRCNDIEKQNLFSRLSGKISLVFYQEVKQEWEREEYIGCCNRNERSMAWWRLGIWKLRESWKGVEKGTFPLCLGKEDTKHILLECPETKDWKMEMLRKRWLDINEEIAYRKVLRCTKKMMVKNIGKLLFMVKCKWEGKVKNLGI